MEKSFVRARSIKDIVISVILIVCGSVLLIMPADAGVHIAGVFLILIGAVVALVFKSEYKDPETGCRYRKKEYCFPLAKKSSITNALRSNPESIEVDRAEKLNSLQLDIYYSKASRKAYLRLFEYVPYEYVPCTQMYEYEMSRIESLIK